MSLHATRTLREVDTLIDAVRAEATRRTAVWAPMLENSDYRKSAANFAAYLALRRHDLRPLQDELMVLGLSSLGRLESRVLAGLQALRASLAAVAQQPVGRRPSEAAFFSGQTLLARRTQETLAVRPGGRPVGLLVTCPPEAADGPAFMRALAELRVEAVRINCAHDDAETWARMIRHARAAARRTGHRMRVFMDLAGPKIRTGQVRSPKAARIERGDEFTLVPEGRLDDVPGTRFAAECTLAAPLAGARPGDRVFYDDGKLTATVSSAAPEHVVAIVDHCKTGGMRLKPEKGLNFPDTEFEVDALTAKDLADLDFITKHADGVAYSFVQSAGDVARLQDALAERRPDWGRLALVLKIETPRAVTNLPDILVRAASRQPTAVMIARGDLAVEIGFARLAEMQEELLWLCEAAHVPVIWATQVLENLVKEGTPLRGEMTDAAMAARAECVMLNKGPHLLRAIEQLDTLLERMDEHQHKKTPRLRALTSW